MTVLSRLDLDPRRREARRILSSPGILHALVQGSVPTAPQGARTLWRIDPGEYRQVLYVQSEVMPDFTALVEQAGWPVAQPWQSASLDPVLDRLRDGDRYQFRVTVNPTYSRRAEGERSRGVRVGHVTAQQQLDWFLTRAPRWGMDAGRVETPDDVTATVVERRVLSFGKERGRRRVTVSTATMAGHLTVTSAACLRDAIRFGLGPAKAYGCGLLTLAPA